MAYEVEKAFFSRKNKAFLVIADGDRAVLKEYVLGDPNVEWRVLSEGFKKGLNVPRPISLSGGEILMEYLEGEPLSNRRVLGAAICAKLARWLYEFHKAFPGYKRGDAMLRNFIETREGVFGIDFEEYASGDQIDDLSMLCVSILTERPMFSREKIDAAKNIMNHYEKLIGYEVGPKCIRLMERDLFAIYRRRRHIRGMPGVDVLEWIPFYKTIL